MLGERFKEVLINNKGPQDFNQTLYKYRNWRTDEKNNIEHQSVFYKPELYLSSIINFADNEDFQFYLRYDLLSFNQLVQKYYNVLLTEFNYAIDDFTKAIKNNELHNLEKFRQIIDSGRPLLNDFYLRLEKALKIASEKFERYKDYQNVLDDNQLFFRDPTNMKFGICSLCTKPNIKRMWDQYSNIFSGYCIGFKAEYFNMISRSPILFPVIYYKEYPIILPLNGTNENTKSLDELYLSACLKNETFEYESEFRIVVHNGVYEKIKIPQKFVSEVYIGYKMLKNDQAEIIQYSQRYYPEAKLYLVKDIGGQLEILRIID